LLGNAFDKHGGYTLNIALATTAQGSQMHFNRNILTAVIVAATLSACSTTKNTIAPPASATSAPPPKLVVLIIVDGLPMWQVTSYESQLAPSGFRRFLVQGATYSNAYYQYARTVTAAGHATILTGAYPNRTGIIDNDWRDTNTWEMVYNTGDEAHTYLEHKTPPLSGTSPKKLLADSLGDVLKRASPQSKVIAISGKDRGAILPAGKLGTAYMYMNTSGKFASTTYYMREHPQWVTDYFATNPTDRYFNQTWTPLLAESEYKQSVPDGASWQVDGAMAKLPMLFGSASPDAKPTQAFYARLLQSPFGDAITLDFARAAIQGESLGADDVPDILSISLSSHDYVNHAYGAESRLSHDHLLWLDRALEKFFADLDTRIGKDNYVAVLTADHGFAPTPEYALSIGKDAGRANMTLIGGRLNIALEKKYGEGKWVQGFSSNMMVLNHALLREKNVNATEMEKDASQYLATEPEIVTTLTRTELINGTVARAGQFGTLLKNSFYAERSGDVAYVLKRFWFASSRNAGSTHGTPHDYDRHVPIMFYGAPWVTPKRHTAAVEVADIAPTLADILKIAAPLQSQGKVLPQLRK
jgi:hypothetical protein